MDQELLDMVFHDLMLPMLRFLLSEDQSEEISQIYYRHNTISHRRQVVLRTRKLMLIAVERKQNLHLKHFHTSCAFFRERILQPATVWGVMTSLISTHFNTEGGRTEIMQVIQLDYLKYFTEFERALLNKLSSSIISTYLEEQKKAETGK